MNRDVVKVFIAVFLTFPWTFSWLTHTDHPPILTALLSGLAVISSSFLVSWSAETAELDVPRSLSLAVVALLAVLPEYAVDAYFAWMAGKVNGEYVHYATANMTGANRLLIGVGWSIVALTAILRMRKRVVRLDEGIRLEILTLLVATLYSFTIPLKGCIHPIDSLFLISTFVAYVYLATRSYREEIELEGVPKYLSSLPPTLRRFAVISLFVFSAFIIVISVDAFAESLLDVAKEFGLNEFLMVQWIAPLASESPEFIVALYLVRRLRFTAGMNALISSKVNQWTLLIGCLPLIYSLALGHLSPLPLDSRQREELILTSAQSLFGIAVISDLKVSVWESLTLLILFLSQFFYEGVETRFVLSLIYISLSIPLLVKERESLIKIFRGF